MTCCAFGIGLGFGITVGLAFGIGLTFGVERTIPRSASVARLPELSVGRVEMFSRGIDLDLVRIIPRSASDARRPELSVGRVEMLSRICRVLFVSFLPVGIYLPFLAGFLAVLALSLKSFADGAPLAPALRIFSPDPAAIRAFLALIFAYNPGFI